jgi:hypothetical protein
MPAGGAPLQPQSLREPRAERRLVLELALVDDEGAPAHRGIGSARTARSGPVSRDLTARMIADRS